MAGNSTRRDVELRINANDLSGKSLADLLETFEKLRKSQEELNKAAGDGTRHIRELTGDVKDLQAVALEVAGRGSMVDQFEKLEQAAQNASTRLEKTKQNLAAFNAKQKDGAQLVGKQATQFKTLTTQVANAEKAFDKAKAKVKDFEQELGALGAGGAEKTRQELLKFGESVGVALTKAEQAVRRYDEVLRESALREEAAAKAKRDAAKAAAELKHAQDGLTSSVAFNKQGRDALTAASSVEVLTRDYDKLSATSRQAGDGIRDIINPTRQALASLNGLEAEIKRLNGQLNSMQAGPKLGEELKQIRAQYTAFAVDAGRAAASLGDDIGNYRKAEESLAALRSRIEGAQQSVREFASQMSVASEPSEKLARDLATSQAKLKGFVSEFDREAQALANLRVRLREAGVDVNNLADAESRLAAVAGGVVDSQRKIEAAASQVSKLAQAASDLKSETEALASRKAFNQVGDDALKAASNIEALSRDFNALVTSSVKAGDGIRAIIDPSRQALSSLDGLETQTKQLNEQLEKAASSVKLRDEVRKLRSEYGSLAADAGKAAASLGDDIGAYRQAEQALATLRARVEDARHSVLQFGQQMSQAQAPSEQLEKSLAKAKGNLNTLVAEFERQSTALAKMRGALRDAGVNTDQLAEAEGRLASVARGVVRAQESLGLAAVKVGKGSGEAAKGLKLFDEHGRKALSVAQRLRGEMLSLASSYVGLFAAINVAKSSVDAAVSREGILRRLELVEGSADKAKLKFDELRKSADQLGVNFEASAEGFSNIAIGAKEAGLTSEELDRFFTNLSMTTRGLALNGEKTGRVFTAVSQIFGKNKIQSEELTGQLGEHLPAVVAKAAKAMNMSSEELTKHLEAGNLSVRALIVIFDEYAKHIASLSKNNDSAVDAIERFNNAMYDLKLAIADSGFLKTFTRLLQEVSEAAKKGELRGAAEGLGNLLRAAAEAARFLLEHSEATKVVFVSLIALNIGKTLLSVAASMKTLGISSSIAAVAVRGLGAALAFVAANPVVLVIAGLVALIALTDTGQAAFRAWWQTMVEFGGALGDLLRLDFSGFADRVKGSMDRVSAAFRGAKKDAKDLEDVANGKKSGQSTRVSSGTVTAGGDVIGASDVHAKARRALKVMEANTWEADPRLKDQRLAEAELTRRTLAGIEKNIADVRKAAAKETAKTIHNVEGEVRAEYQETQDNINQLVERGKKTNDAATLDSAKNLQVALDKEIGIIVAARKKRKAAEEGEAAHRSAVAEALEEAKQRAEVTKDGLRLERAVLEQNYKEGLVSLDDYYAQRLDLTKRGLKAELDAALAQTAIWKKELGRDPQAPKQIAKLDGAIKGNAIETDVAVRESDTELAERQKAVRRQLSALRQELSQLTGDDVQAELRNIQNWYEDQLDTLKDLTGAARERAQAELDAAVAIKIQNVAMATRRKAAQEKLELTHARIDTKVTKGELSELQELDERSQANREYLKVLEAEEEQLRKTKQTGTDTYKSLVVEIERLKGSTDLLDIKLTGLFNEAASGAVDELFHEDKEGLDRLQKAQQALAEFNRQQQLGVAMTEKQRAEYARLTEEVDKASKGMESRTERALKSFSKTMGKAIVKSFTDELATSLVKLLKESGIFDFAKSLFTGLGGATKGHTGAVIGHGGGTPARVSPWAFVGAPRYHSGGLPGLRRDEVAFIGLKGEEVLSRNDPRNVLNGGLKPGGGTAGTPAGVRLEVHPDALHMTLRDWFERELARSAATR